MSKRKTPRITVSAIDALRRSRNEQHIQHKLGASGTGAHRNRKRYCRKAKHRAGYRGGT